MWATSRSKSTLIFTGTEPWDFPHLYPKWKGPSSYILYIIYNNIYIYICDVLQCILLYTVYRWPVGIHHATGHVAAKSPQLAQGRDLECTERLRARRLHCDNSLDASPSQIPKCPNNKITSLISLWILFHISSLHLGKFRIAPQQQRSCRCCVASGTLGTASSEGHDLVLCLRKGTTCLLLTCSHACVLRVGTRVAVAI